MKFENYPVFDSKIEMSLAYCLYDEDGQIVDEKHFWNWSDARAYMSSKYQELSDDGIHNVMITGGRCLVSTCEEGLIIAEADIERDVLVVFPRSNKTIEDKNK